MSNKILLKHANAIFEPHILPEKAPPFIHHMNRMKGQGISNFHENPEVLWFIGGKGHVLYDGRWLPVGPGDTVVINPYAVHQVVSEEELVYFCLIIDKDFCRLHAVDIKALQFTEQLRDERLDALLSRVVEERGHSKPFAYTAMMAAVLDVLLYLCRNYSTPRTAPLPVDGSERKLVGAAIHYIKENIASKLTVDDIAASVGLSKYYFLREFKRLTGYTPVSYINILRCEYAKELLRSGKHKVREVAVMCGFENDSYFANVFKKHTGMLPSHFFAER